MILMKNVIWVKWLLSKRENKLKLVLRELTIHVSFKYCPSC